MELPGVHVALDIEALGADTSGYDAMRVAPSAPSTAPSAPAAAVARLEMKEREQDPNPHPLHTYARSHAHLFKCCTYTPTLHTYTHLRSELTSYQVLHLIILSSYHLIKCCILSSYQVLHRSGLSRHA